MKRATLILQLPILLCALRSANGIPSSYTVSDTTTDTPGMANSSAAAEHKPSEVTGVTATLGATIWKGIGNLAKGPNGSFGLFTPTGLFEPDTALSRLDPASGQPVWTQPTSVFVNSECLSGWGVVVSLESGTIIGRRPSDGVTMWSTPTTPSLYPNPIVCPDTQDIILDGPGVDGSFRALTRSTGRVLWTVTVPGASYPSIDADATNVYFNFWVDPDLTKYRTMVVDGATGAVKATYMCPDLHSMPTHGNGVVACTDGNANVTRLDTVTGKVLWSVRAGTGDSGVSIRADGAIMGTFLDFVYYRLVALDPNDGHTLWNRSNPDAFVMIEDSRVIVWDGQMTMLSPDGQELWSAAAGRPTILGGLLFGNDGHNVSRVNLDTGDVLWTYSSPTTVYGLGAVHDGVVFAGIAGASLGTDSFVGIDVNTGAFAWQSDQAFALYEPRAPIPFDPQFAFDGPITIVRTLGPLVAIQTGN